MKKQQYRFTIRLISFLLLLICGASNSLFSQNRPDLTKIKSQEDKLEAWRIHCNGLLSDMKFNKQLIKDAKYGISIAEKGDYNYRGIFTLFTGVAYENEKQFDSAGHYLEKAALLLEKAKRVKNVMLSLSRLDNIYSYTNNVSKRRITLERMKKISDTSKNLSVKQLAMVALSGYYSDIEDYETSIKYRLQNLELYKKLIKTDTLAGNESGIGTFLTNIAGLYIQMQRYQKAVEYLDEAKIYIGDGVLRRGEQTLFGHYVKSYLGLNKIDSAKAYYYRIYDGMKGVDSIYNLLSDVNKDLGEYYLNRNKLDSALYYIKKGVLLGKKAPEADPLINANVLYGKLLYKQGKYVEVIGFLTPALKGNYDFDKETLVELHNILSKCFAALKQWDKAYYHKEKYSELNDAIQIAQANKNFNEIEGKYQNSQKTQQIKLKNLEIEDARKQRVWLISGLSLLLFAAVLLYIIYRNKKNAADLLDKKNIQLDIANEQLNTANKTKAKLFSIITHDLRSPISQLFTFLRIQQVNPSQISEEEKAGHQQKLMSSASKLLETMEDLLLWSKSQLDHFELTIEEIAIHQLFEESITLMQNQADAKNVEIKVGTLALRSLKSDQNLLIIVLRNLLQNAIGNTYNNTSIVLSAALDEEKKPFIAIVNKGDIIRQEKIDELLSNQNIKSKSSGYGLLIVKELLQKINSDLKITSNSEITTVRITFN
ncbi:MAG TPA: tetratricopeptide repeat-containing sensor histidine kinase [Pedobacter sp.]|nr:tetratricopeptide repeat-containing sensor histidine kinase [Pedobacter sp.]